MWRVEWKPRQSGTMVNYLYPHWHMLLFNENYICADDLREMWWGVIKSKQLPRVNVIRMGTDDHAAKYVSKYASFARMKRSKKGRKARAFLCSEKRRSLR
jgi:hypothetical protein